MCDSPPVHRKHRRFHHGEGEPNALVHPSITILVALLVAVAPAAHAFDLSGHWSGTYKCKGNYDGEKDGFEEVLEANITQSGSTVGANFTFDGTPYSYNGLAVANLAKPDKGDVMLVICGSDDDLGSTTFDELGRFKVTTKPSKGTGSISGISVYSRSGPPQVYTCKWKLKRTSAVNPNVPTACP